MTYLIDNQLPMALVKHLQSKGLEAVHVSQCGLEQASDQEIWNYAKSHKCIVVSKDEDFFHLSGIDVSGPAFVWVRLGNCRKKALFDAFDSILPQLIEAVAEGSRVIEIR